MAGLRYIGGESFGEAVKVLVRKGASFGLVHDLPMRGGIQLRFLVLVMRFKMFRCGEVVGEFEKMVTCSRAGDGRYEYSVELDGYEFDAFEVVVEDIAGNEIHRKTHSISVGAGQRAVYNLSVVVE